MFYQQLTLWLLVTTNNPASAFVKADNFTSLFIVKPSAPMFQWAYLCFTAGISCQPLEDPKVGTMNGGASETKCGKRLLPRRKQSSLKQLSWKAGLETSYTKCMVTYTLFSAAEVLDPVCRGRLWSVFFYLETTERMIVKIILYAYRIFTNPTSSHYYWSPPRPIWNLGMLFLSNTGLKQRLVSHLLQCFVTIYKGRRFPDLSRWGRI